MNARRKFSDTLVSVIMPTYNAARFVGSAIESVLAQGHTELELLVTDDCSTDDTWDQVGDLADRDPRIKARRLRTNSGAGVARADSIRRARGRYLAFLDSDDIWLPGKLETQLPAMREGRYAMSFGPYYLIDEDGKYTGHVVDADGPETVSYQDMLRKRATMGCLTVMVDRCVTPQVTMPPIKTGQDYATWLSILRDEQEAVRVDEPLGCYRIVAGSISRNKWRKAQRQWAIYRTLERLPRIQAAACFAHYAVRALTAPRRAAVRGHAPGPSSRP